KDRVEDDGLPRCRGALLHRRTRAERACGNERRHETGRHPRTQMTQPQTEKTAQPIRRTREIEEITNLYFIHPLPAALRPHLARLRITPNGVCITGMLFGIAAAFAYYHACCGLGDRRFAIIGFVLMIAWHVMDGADGQLARFTHSFSYFGKVLDGISDNVT